VGRYSTIGVTRELNDSVLVDKLFVNPLGTFGTTSVVNTIEAKIPLLNIIGDVELGANFLRVQVLNDWVTESARR